MHINTKDGNRQQDSTLNIKFRKEDDNSAPEYRTLQAIWNLRDDRSLSAGEVHVLDKLIAHANEDGISWPGAAKLAAEARMGKQAVKVAIRRLEKRSGPFLLTVKRDRKAADGDDDTHLYTIRPGEGWAESFKTDDGRTIQKIWNGRGWDHTAPRGGSYSTHRGGESAPLRRSLKEEKKEKEISPSFPAREESGAKHDPAMDREDVKEVFVNWKTRFNHPEMSLQPDDAKVIAATIDGLNDAGNKGKNFCLNVAKYIALAGHQCKSPAEMYGDGFIDLLMEANRIKNELGSQQQAAA